MEAGEERGTQHAPPPAGADGHATATLEVRRATLEEVLPLRHAVLRAGLPVESARFAGDDDPQTWHFAAFIPDAQGHAAAVIGCASFMRSSWQGAPAWQLRGMATAPEHRGRGVGQTLLAYAEAALARASDVRLLWCNARVEAVGFYEKQGWSVASPRFDIEGVGGHHRMVRRLNDPPPA